jgi:chemotaxis protein methyltransferase CheR
MTVAYSPSEPTERHSGCEAREFDYTEQDFLRACALIRARAGITLGAAKQDMVYSRLARRLRALRLQRFGDYLDFLEQDEGDEWEAFTNALTTNLTSFFREPHHFRVLARQLAQRGRDRPAVVWCCAASTGEEAYSIAITAVEALRSPQPPVRILATDIDTNVLARARQGIYAIDRLERMPRERIERFFLRGVGAHEGQVRVRRELRALVTFRPLNLLADDWSLRGPFDAIFCRNVMIYFDKDTQAQVLRRFAPLLAPDGLLFVGHSESLFHVADTYRLLGQTVYALKRPTR